MADTTSITLLERLKDHSDNDAWYKFYTAYQSFMMGFLRHHGVSEHDAADVCQEVMIVVQKRMRTFTHNGNKGAFRKWLRKVLVTQLGVFRRKSKRQSERLLGEIEEQLGRPDSALMRMWDQEHNRAILAIILDLLSGVVSKKSLDVFRRTFIEEIPAEKVALEFGMTKNAVIVSKSKVLKKARDLGANLIE